MGFQVATYDASKPLIIDPVLSYSTYLGGSGSENVVVGIAIALGGGIAVDSSGNAYVVGITYSTDFPTANPFQATNGGFSDGFVTKLNAEGSALVYSTYLGGGSNDYGLGIAVDSSGNAYVTGSTSSAKFPTANPIQAANRGTIDAFVTKIVEEESLSVSSTSLAFGEAAVNSTQDLTFTIQNIGEDTLSGTLTQLASPFSIVSGEGSFGLEPETTQIVIVRFSPTSSGSFGGVVNITSNGGSASITLSGIGTSPSGPALSVCGTALDFGSVVVDSSADLFCTVTNTGTDTLTGTASTSAPFSIVSGGSFSLSAGQSQTFTLRFTPSIVGPVVGSVSLSSNGGNETITLSGIGIQGAALAVSPTTLNFGGVRVGSSKDLLLTVQNTGAETLTRNACAPNPFTVVTGASFTLAAGQSQTLTVRFSPSTVDQFNGTLTFTSNLCTDLNSQPDPATVLVSGTGLPEQEAVGIAYVVNQASHSVSVIDTTTQQEVIAPIPVGTAPVALALTPDGSKLYVVNSGSPYNVSVIDTATLQVTKTIPVGLNPKAIVVTPNGQKAYVADNGFTGGEGSVSVINVSDDTVSSLAMSRPNPSVLALSPEGTVLYVLGEGSSLVSVVDTTTNQVNRFPADDGPVAIAFNPEGTRAYIANRDGNTVSVVDTTKFPPTKITDMGVGEAPRSVAVSPDGTKVYVANFLDHTLSVIDTAQNVPVQTLSVDGWQGPWNILLDPKSVGTSEPRALVINRTSNTVGILNLVTDQPVGTVSVGKEPEQGAFDPELPQAVVTNEGDDTISFVDTTGTTTSLSVPVGTVPVAVATALQAPVSNENPPVADAGPDQTVRTLSRVTLDGTGSFDPQGDPLSFLWTQTEGPSVQLSDSTSSTPSFRAPLQLSGSVVLSFQLVVNAGEADSLPDTVKVTVEGLRP